ncbi:hypothetical protein ZWY2020_006388 [Hordeum vulgare]|nr:hypothetical protein ZWY2020_006388 [Hordeum vulgare]
MSSSGRSNNPFGSSFSLDCEVPNATHIRDVPFSDHVPIKLSYKEANYYASKTYFNLLFREYNLGDHVDGSTNLLAMGSDANWMAIDTTPIPWFFLTVSSDIFQTIVRDGDDAYTVWTKINDIFTDNKLQRVVFLQHGLFGCHQNDLSIDAYCLRLNTLSDELNDIESKIGDELLLSTLTASLNEDFNNGTSNLILMVDPTFERAVSYLHLEERLMKHARTLTVHTVLVVGLSNGRPAPPPPHQLCSHALQLRSTLLWPHSRPSHHNRRSRNSNNSALAATVAMATALGAAIATATVAISASATVIRPFCIMFCYCYL